MNSKIIIIIYKLQTWLLYPFSTTFLNQVLSRELKTYKCLLSRSSPPEAFLGKGVLKICCKFTGEHLLLILYLATLLKPHFGMGVLLYICWIFSDHHLIRKPIEGASVSLKVAKNISYYKAKCVIDSIGFARLVPKYASDVRFATFPTNSLNCLGKGK